MFDDEEMTIEEVRRMREMLSNKPEGPVPIPPGRIPLPRRPRTRMPKMPFIQKPQRIAPIPKFGDKPGVIDAKHDKKGSDYKAGSPIKVPLPIKDEY